jgi:sugar lactone lactonase YvrE
MAQAARSRIARRVGGAIATLLVVLLMACSAGSPLGVVPTSLDTSHWETVVTGIPWHDHTSPPEGLALDRAGNIYVSSNRVYKYSPSGQQLATFGAGSMDAADVCGCYGGITVAGNGDIFVAVSQRASIAHLASDGKLLNRIGPGWDIRSSKRPEVLNFSGPGYLALDSQGNVVVADGDLNSGGRISTFTPSGQLLGNVILGGTPTAIAFDPDWNLYAADEKQMRVQKLPPLGKPGKPLATWPSPEFPNFTSNYLRGIPGTAVSEALSAPTGIAVDSAANIYVAYVQSHRVDKLAPDGQLVARWASLSFDPSDAPGEFDGPISLTIDVRNDDLYVLEAVMNSAGGPNPPAARVRVLHNARAATAPVRPPMQPTPIAQSTQAARSATATQSVPRTSAPTAAPADGISGNVKTALGKGDVQLDGGAIQLRYDDATDSVACVVTSGRGERAITIVRDWISGLGGNPDAVRVACRAQGGQYRSGPWR